MGSCIGEGQRKRAELSDSNHEAKRSRSVALAMRQADRRTNHQVLGAVLLAVGGNWLLAELNLFPFGWPGLLAVGLMTLGLAMIGTAKAGRTKPLVALGVAMTVLLAMSSGVGGEVGRPAIGDRSVVISSPAQLEPVYDMTMGDMTLDLTRLELDERQTVEASVRVGDILVIVPEDLPVRVEAEVSGPGDIDLFGSRTEGINPDDEHEDEGFATAPVRLVLQLSAAVGDITVERG